MTFTPENLRKVEHMSENELHQNMINGLQAQLDAAKQMFNDSSNMCLTLRTQLNMSQVIIQDFNQKLEAAKKRIAELEAPKENPDAANPQ